MYGYFCGWGALQTISNVADLDLKFVLHVTSDQFSDKFNNGGKKSNWFIATFCILRLWFYLVDVITYKFFIYPDQICYACY